MFIGAEIRLDLGFDAVQATLADLVRGSLLRRASSGAYDEWQACPAQSGPWVTALDMCRLVQVLARDMVTRADCATWTMRWEVTGPGGPLFPALDADIKLTPAGAGATVLAVCAAYRPPLGGQGMGPDRAIMHQAAEVMIQSFTIHIQMAIVRPAASPPSSTQWDPAATGTRARDIVIVCRARPEPPSRANDASKMQRRVGAS